MNLDDALKEQSAAIERQKQAMAESARMNAYNHYSQEQINALLEIAKASQEATENAKKAAEEAGKTAKRALVAAWVSGVASSISAIASIIAIFL